MKHRALSILVAIVLAVGLSGVTPAWITQASSIFNEGFGNTTVGQPITTSNTSFGYVRVGSTGGAITAINSTLGGGYHNTKSMELGGSTTSSLNGVGDFGFTPMEVTTLNFRMKITYDSEETNDTFFIGMGDGGTFTQNSIFANADLLWAIQSYGRKLQYRSNSGTWVNIGTELEVGREYHFHIVANGGANIIEDYNGLEDIGAGKLDVYLDGTLIGNELPIPDNQDATAFRIYQVNNATTAEFDNIYVDNGAIPPFTPTSVTLIDLHAGTSRTPILLLAGLLLLATLLSMGWIRATDKSSLPE